MSHVHTFLRLEELHDSRQVGEVYSPDHDRYDEGARYLYRQGALDLVLFWSAPSSAEIAGFRTRPIEVGLYTHGTAAFLLYRIQDVCEWSDLAFSVHLVPEAERELPAEPPGERARLRLTLVDAGDGVIRAKRLVSLDKVMTQALRHVMREQAGQAFSRLLYDAAVQEAHARYPEPEAMVQAAECVEPALG